MTKPRRFGHNVPGRDKVELRFLALLLRRFIRVFPLEPFHASRGVEQLLLAREEWMAIRADFHAQQRPFVCRARLECVAARAVYSHFVVVGMDSLLHRDAPIL